LATSWRARGCPDARTVAACDDLLVKKPPVLIVDDHPGFRSSARALLEAEGFDVVGEADNGVSALAAIGRLHPGVVLLDIQLPDIDGSAVAERLAHAGDPPAAVLVSTGASLLPAAWLAACPRVHLEERVVGECPRCACLVTA
jgi:CheY-like chemotaxis protein